MELINKQNIMHGYVENSILHLHKWTLKISNLYMSLILPLQWLRMSHYTNHHSDNEFIYGNVWPFLYVVSNP